MSEFAYKELLIEILDKGEKRQDRTGVGTISLFGKTLEYDMEHSFPLFTGKKINFNVVAGELLWFISGSTNVYDLAEITYGDTEKKTIWHDNAFAPYWRNHAKSVGDLGRIYGEQWRNWVYIDKDNKTHKIDQIKDLVKAIKAKSTSRRLMLQSYSPDQVQSEASIPACHTSAQFYVRNDTHLDCLFTMRSNDMLLGHPYNVASYALLTYLFCHQSGLTPGRLIFQGGDCHIYENHIDAVNRYLNSPVSLKLPKVKINAYDVYKDTGEDIHLPTSIEYIKLKDIILEDYDPGPVITAPMAI